jgi:hypothetical protein
VSPAKFATQRASMRPIEMSPGGPTCSCSHPACLVCPSWMHLLQELGNSRCQKASDWHSHGTSGACISQMQCSCQGCEL